MQSRRLPSSATGLAPREISLDDAALLQRFFVENPEYFHIVHGAAPQPDEARDEIDDALPAGWSYTHKWKIGYFDSEGRLLAFVSIVSDLLAQGVWHIGLFMLATPCHGSSLARQLHAELEAWAVGEGARWLRLSVVQDNARAQGFWNACGYAQVRTRDGIELGRLQHQVRIMIKPLAGDALADYLALMPRDRSEEQVPS